MSFAADTTTKNNINNKYRNRETNSSFLMILSSTLRRIELRQQQNKVHQLDDAADSSPLLLNDILPPSEDQMAVVEKMCRLLGEVLFNEKLSPGEEENLLVCLKYDDVFAGCLHLLAEKVDEGENYKNLSTFYRHRR
jgi:CRISPR/Cas system-associated protein endoribonuclease Cas2